MLRRLLLRCSLLRGRDDLCGRGATVARLLLLLAVLRRLLLQARESVSDGLGRLLVLRSINDDDLERPAVKLDAVVRAHSLHGGVECGKSDFGGALGLAVGAVVHTSREYTSNLAEEFLRFPDRQ